MSFPQFDFTLKNKKKKNHLSLHCEFPQFGFTLKKKKVIYSVLPTFHLSFCCELSFSSIWSYVTTFLKTEKKNILPTLCHIVFVLLFEISSSAWFYFYYSPTKIIFFFLKRIKKSVRQFQHFTLKSDSH